MEPLYEHFGLKKCTVHLTRLSENFQSSKDQSDAVEVHKTKMPAPVVGPDQAEEIKKYQMAIKNDLKHKVKQVRIKRGRILFECTICGYKQEMIRAYQFEKHLITHRPGNPFRCPLETCNKMSASHISFKSHLKTHLLERPFHCEVCNKCFLNKSRLNYHIKRHDGSFEKVKKHECNLCGRKVSSTTLSNFIL